jgi:4-aminobutyrate aminotransferase-like enzyme
VPVGRWGEPRLLHGEDGGDGEPATLHLGADLFVDAGTDGAGAARRAWSSASGDRELLLRHDLPGDTPVWLRLAGLVAPPWAGRHDVPAGTRVGTVAGHTELLPPHLHVQLCLAPVETLPGLAHASQRTAWLALCPDPSALVGVAVAAPAEDPQATGDARRRHVAAAQQLYYEDPPEMVRGWRQHLYDVDGRAYLDVVNNVAVVGHSHPRVLEAAGRQLQLLNTNSRFLYAALGRYAARLVELLPAPLDTVFLVNSGSEANDLALRLARAATDRRDVVVLEGAYHGWTTATVELTTSPFYPGSSAADVPGRHVVAAPNLYRGPYGEDDPDAGRRYADLVRGACETAARGGAGVAAFISEPQLGNAGGVIPPPGYLTRAYAHVRAAGGVCIADEVQVGFGRLGTWFWAFEQQEAIPDIVTVAKPAGNGFPLGAVITSRAIADRFARRTTVFSSVGGSPLSCEVGIAVLDVIRDERLQDNARLVGARLRIGLEELARRHELVGAVHGLGLHLGVELVVDRDTKAPATRAAAAVCERLLDRGVIVRPTGDHSNVLKVKPPLCFDVADADRLVDSLDPGARPPTTRVAPVTRDAPRAGSLRSGPRRRAPRRRRAARRPRAACRRRRRCPRPARPARADDRRGHVRLPQDPGQRQLAQRQPLALGDRPQPLDGLERAIREQVTAQEAAHLLGRRPGVGGRRLARSVLARQDALGERREDDLRDPVGGARRDDLGLRSTPQHRVLRLRGDEALDARQRQRGLDLGRGPLAEPDVARLPLPDDLRERLHRLLERRALVVAMGLVEVDVVDAQASQRRVDLLLDLARERPRSSSDIGK